MRKTNRKDGKPKPNSELFRLSDSHLTRTNMPEQTPVVYTTAKTALPGGFSGCSSVPAGPSAGPERSRAMEISGALCRCGGVRICSSPIFPVPLHASALLPPLSCPGVPRWPSPSWAPRGAPALQDPTSVTP